MSPDPLKAMVLTAGAGTRLRPLTYEVVKPLVPILNRPSLNYVLALLKTAGVKEAVLNLHNFPDQIRAFAGDGSAWNLKIAYSHEERLLGTAGALKKVAPAFMGGTFVLLSGDGLSDVDLKKAVAFHKARRALATLVLKSMSYRFEYGVTLTDGRGKVKGFVEKPMWGDVFSDTANTGIYIFEPEILKYIPDNQPYDFGHELFPKLLKLKKPVFAYRHEGYWRDIGNLAEYRLAHQDALDGKIKGVRPPGKETAPGVWVEEGAKVDPTALLVEPCLIGLGAVVGARAEVGPHTALGEEARLGERAALKNSILFPRVHVGADAHLAGCVVGPGVEISEKSVAYHAELLTARV